MANPFLKVFPKVPETGSTVLRSRVKFFYSGKLFFNGKLFLNPGKLVETVLTRKVCWNPGKKYIFLCLCLFLFFVLCY